MNQKQEIKNPQRNFINTYDGDKVIGSVDRTYADEINVVLPCGYSQRFWVDLTDRQAIDRAVQMKKVGIN